MITEDEFYSRIRDRIAAFPAGTELGLVELYGEGWEETGTVGERRNFGKLVKTAVKEGRFPEVEWVRIENSGRYDVYRINGVGNV